MSKSASNILIEAADIINERGLCKGAFEGADGSVCSRGALNVVRTGHAFPMRRRLWDLEAERAVKALEQEISVRTGRMGRITEFNDYGRLSGRKVSKRQVVAVFRAAARRLRAQGL